ncbi:hypothetical protein [Bradyrhizobium sp. 2S1]|uniref:hypothetical protein n=1 Tax=Bradyrhizobium sp. 2S1 TaxID=1404429 RepID=UPI001409DCD8|nr:hypothetical protein [Bradyrhizobium sp. 2S1]MCK7664522.1 hypothetical protein [Bradyrhizobium sp. 2S1]
MLLEASTYVGRNLFVQTFRLGVWVIAKPLDGVCVVQGEFGYDAKASRIELQRIEKLMQIFESVRCEVRRPLPSATTGQQQRLPNVLQSAIVAAVIGKRSFQRSLNAANHY